MKIFIVNLLKTNYKSLFSFAIRFLCPKPFFLTWSKIIKNHLTISQIKLSEHFSLSLSLLIYVCMLKFLMVTERWRSFTINDFIDTITYFCF